MNLIDFMKEDPTWELKVVFKTCTKCHKSLPEDHFSMASGGSYRRSECRGCSSKLSKEARNLDVPPPPPDYCCPICDRNAEECSGAGGKKLGPWAKDHDHKSGLFRGWLCHSCNRGIGAFKDNIERLRRALRYLEAFLARLEARQDGPSSMTDA